MPDGQSTYVALPNGSYVEIPANASPEQLAQFKQKLSQFQQPPATSASLGPAFPAPAPAKTTIGPQPAYIPRMAKDAAKMLLGPTVQGRAMSDMWNATHAWAPQGMRDVMDRASQLAGIIGAESTVLGAPEALEGGITKLTSEAPQMAARMLRSPETGEITVTPGKLLERIIPQRADVAEAQHVEKMGKGLDDAWNTRMKELGSEERLRADYGRGMAQGYRPMTGPGYQDMPASEAQRGSFMNRGYESQMPGGASMHPSSVAGGRPTLTEQNLTRIIKEPVRTPEDDQVLTQAFGDQATRKAGEGLVDWQGRLLGYTRGMRSATQMADVESGLSGPTSESFSGKRPGTKMVFQGHAEPLSEPTKMRYTEVEAQGAQGSTASADVPKVTDQPGEHQLSQAQSRKMVKQNARVHKAGAQGGEGEHSGPLP